MNQQEQQTEVPPSSSEVEKKEEGGEKDNQKDMEEQEHMGGLDTPPEKMLVTQLKGELIRRGFQAKGKKVW